MNCKNKVSIEDRQSVKQSYSKAELNGLKAMLQTIKDDNSRAQMPGWGNHNEYTKGY